jgi:hypothetical protein
MGNSVQWGGASSKHLHSKIIAQTLSDEQKIQWLLMQIVNALESK